MDDESNHRIIYADILKIVAIVAVIIIHSSAPLVYTFYSVKLNWWWIGNVFDSAMRWGVPIFIMVSGMLLLNPNKEESPKTFFRKRFSRVLIPFVFWECVYIIWIYKHNIIKNEPLPLLKIIESFIGIGGPIFYHLWFINLILGLYLLTPIFRIYVKNSDSNNLKYFLILWFITNGIVNFTGKFTNLKIGLIDLDFFVGYSGYYVLGYYLSKIKLNKNKTYTVYFLSIISFIITMLGTFLLTKGNNGMYTGYFIEYLSPNVIIMSIGVFILFENINWEKYLENKNFIKDNIIVFSSLSFGIYLIHALVLELLSSNILSIKINAMLFNPLVGIPLTALITLLSSFFIIKLLKKSRLTKGIC